MKQFGWQVVGLFHARDAATGKARSPRVDCCTDGTTSVMVVEEWRWRHMLVVVRGLNAVQMISRLPAVTITNIIISCCSRLTYQITTKLSRTTSH